MPMIASVSAVRGEHAGQPRQETARRQLLIDQLGQRLRREHRDAGVAAPHHIGRGLDQQRRIAARS